MKKLRTEAEFMARYKGVPAYKVAQAMNRLTAGNINWNHCSKSWLAMRWSESDRAKNPVQHHRELENVTLKMIDAEIAKIAIEKAG